jgi:hypothetical protein
MLWWNTRLVYFEVVLAVHLFFDDLEKIALICLFTTNSPKTAFASSAFDTTWGQKMKGHSFDFSPKQRQQR